MKHLPASFLRLLLQGLLSAFFAFAPARAFDSGHHWELTAQALNEAGFSEDARQIVCVSNWLLDYYSSSPTGSRTLREELSKLHCDNLCDAESARRYLAHFSHNAKNALTSLAGGKGSDHEVLLTLGAVLHVVQDLYSHSNWPEHCSTKDSLSNRTWFCARERLPAGFITGCYDPRPYVAASVPPDHPPHGSYDHGMHKDAHNREWWPQACFLAYCATREYVEAFRTWIPPARWARLTRLDLPPLEKMVLAQEVQAAYGISLWIDISGEHGHWKGGKSGHKLMFLKSALSFITLSSRSALWYRAWKRYRPLIRGLYTDESAPAASARLVPGLHLRRTAIMLRVRHVSERGRSLDGFLFGKPDFYLTGGVHYGVPRRKPEAHAMPWLLAKPGKVVGSILNPKSEPLTPFEGGLNCVFRDRVLQEAESAESPWCALIIADEKALAASGRVLTLFLNVGEEDPGEDDVADISPSRGHRGVVFRYDLKTGRVLFPDTGETFTAGKGRLITTRGDERRSAEIGFDLFTMPVK